MVASIVSYNDPCSVNNYLGMEWCTSCVCTRNTHVSLNLPGFRIKFVKHDEVNEFAWIDSLCRDPIAYVHTNLIAMYRAHALA